jgi:hypothetical protein
MSNILDDKSFVKARLSSLAKSLAIFSTAGLITRGMDDDVVGG